MFGDLAHFPFLADVWGTAAAWFGAVGTTSAFLLAATAYRRDVKLRRYEQAVMVRIHEKSVAPLGLGALTPENLVLEVHNTSDGYIYSVGGILVRKPLHKFVKDLSLTSPGREDSDPSEEELEGCLQKYRDVSEKLSLGGTVDRVEPGGVATLRFPTLYTHEHQLVVSFMDAQNQLWRIQDDREIDFSGKVKPRLVPVGKGFVRLVKLSFAVNFIFSSPRKNYRRIRRSVRLRLWAFKNAPWGPGVEGWTQKPDIPAVQRVPEKADNDGGQTEADGDGPSQKGPDVS